MKPILWKNPFRTKIKLISCTDKDKGANIMFLTLFENKGIAKIEDLEMWYYMSTILKVTTIKYFRAATTPRDFSE